MNGQSHHLGVFLHLAQASLRRRRPLVRDRMLVLAAVVATSLRLHKLSDYCRSEILQNNPRHLIGHWPSVEEALLDEEFLTLLKRIRHQYPIERAEQLLDSLDIEFSNERDAYYSDPEWAAAILRVSPDGFCEEDAA